MGKRVGTRILAIALYSACAFFVACEDSSGPSSDICWTYFHMKVDSLSVPSEIMQTDTLRIEFYSTPYDGCKKFHRFIHNQEHNNLRIFLIGMELWNVGCYSPPRVIDVGFTVRKTYTGRFYIEVIEPDGSKMIDSVLVLR
jgi:hypothetical protein